MPPRLLLVLVLFAVAACGPPEAPPPAPSSSLAEDIDRLVAAHSEATVAVAVRDPATGFRLDRAGQRSFHAASTMKVPVMIEVFRQARLGRFALGDPLPVENAFRSIVDGSPYRIEDDSDDALYAHLGEAMTVRALVDQMITVSSNLATNLLIDFVSADSVQATADRLGVQAMRVLRGVEDIKAYRLGLNNTATAADLATLLLALVRGEAVSPEDDAAMIAILREQQFNEMIPAGLPDGIAVAHKTGWITEIHHDAAIVAPPEAMPYVLVILTEGIADQAVSAELGAAITRAVHARVTQRR